MQQQLHLWGGLESNYHKWLLDWTKWRVFLCAAMVIFYMLLAFLLLWKYQWSAAGSGGSQNDGGSGSGGDSKTWMPCVKEVSPICLMAFRMVSFSLLAATLTCHVVVYGGTLFYYYTQWTFTLVTIYFGFGSVLSIQGCWQRKKSMERVSDDRWTDEIQGLEDTLLAGTGYFRGAKALDYHTTLQFYQERSAGFFAYVFQLLFQMAGGAVVLTDFVYWFIIFPKLDEYYDFTFLTLVAHSLNLLLLADASLNCLQELPWFGIAYFIFWTGAYVLSQWIVHACESIWWPYPFLDLSSPNAPLWYLVVALMHIPCYGSVVLLVELKKWALSKCQPTYHLVFSDDEIITSC
ncbi:hypothetical protein DM860_008615 [Cuscuta australis]|uniref:Uncharacterized protein n=1 Tax=Cuscuta australis TaxID=267555 RepID=A0A328D549_9ASTE|nr:hypothetical protein DM860_008615 [Cuscuta australis]